MNIRTISVAKDFSKYPTLRHCKISDNSGEEFYHKILNRQFNDAYLNNEKLQVILDGTEGYASSFLDEAFGNLVYDFTMDVVKKNLEIVSIQQPRWKKMIEEETFVQWEQRRKEHHSPEVTVDHPAWIRLINGSLKSNKWEQPM